MPKTPKKTPTTDAASASNSSVEDTAKAPRVQHWKQEKLTVRYHDSLETRPNFIEMALAWGAENNVPVAVEEIYGKPVVKIGGSERRRSPSLFFRETLDQMRELGIGAEEVAEFVRQERERRIASGGIIDGAIESGTPDEAAQVLASSPL